MKRIVFILSFVLVLSCICCAFAADSDYAFAFQPNGENTGVITGVYNPYTFDISHKRIHLDDPVKLVFPEEIDGCKITELSLARQTQDYVDNDGYPLDTYSLALGWKYSVRSIEIPETSKRIDYACFAHCSELREMILPEGLEEIDDLGFFGCSQLEKVVFPSTLRRIGKRAFAYCSELTSVTIPAGVEYLDEEAFNSCPKLTTVQMEGNTTEIRGQNCFDGHTEIQWPAGKALSQNEEILEETFIVKRIGAKVILTGFTDNEKLPGLIAIPEGVTDIAHMDVMSTFRKTLALPSTLTGDIVKNENEFYQVNWEVAEDNPRYRAVNNMLIDETAHTLVSGGRSEDPVIPDGVEVIGENAFADCQLREITLPDSVREIRMNAFIGNSGLSVIDFPESLEICYASAFEGTGIDQPLPLAVLKLDTVQGLDSYAGKTLSTDGVWEYVLFEDNSCAIVGFNKPDKAKGTLNIPAKIDGHPTVAVIWTTTYCYDYDALVIPEGVRLVAKQAFLNYTIRKVSFPKSLEALDPEAFDECPYLKLTDQQKQLFAGVDSALSIPCKFRIMPGGTVEIVDWIDKKSTAAEIPAEINGYPVTSIGIFAFSGSNLVSVIVPEGVQSIGYASFSGCSKLRKIILPEGLSFIGAEAFLDCRSLTDISFPSTLSYIGNDAFAGSSVRDAVLPEGLVYLGERSFAGGKLVSVIIPGSVDEIRSNAFRSQTGLKKVTIRDGVRIIGECAFGQCGLAKLELPDSVRRIGECAFFECNSLQSVSIGNGCEEIGENAFYYCQKLNSVVFGSRLRTIDSGAFMYHGMKEIRLPDSLEIAEASSLFPQNSRNALRVIFSSDAEQFSFRAFTAVDLMSRKVVWPVNMTIQLPDTAVHLKSNLETFMKQNGVTEKQWKISMQESGL